MPIDIYTKLAQDRVLFISDIIDDKVATDVVATLLLQDAENDNEKITLFLNSEGGDIRSVFMIYDVMQLLKSPLETVCIGSAMNETVMLLAAGTKGMRFATHHSIISPSQLVHNASYMTNLLDAKSIMERSKADNKSLLSILAKASGKTYQEVAADFDRKVFFNAKQALNYGLIDGVIGG